MQVESKGGSGYMLTFTDDFSQYTTAYFIKSKSEVLSKFMEYVCLRMRGKVKNFFYFATFVNALRERAVFGPVEFNNRSFEGE